MSEIFLETSALIELSFGNQATRSKIEQLFPADARRVSSQYVFYELSRGFLSYLILTYNKTFHFTQFSEMIAYVGRLGMRRSHAGAVLGSLERYFQLDQPQLSNEQRLIHYRGILRREIRRGLAKVKRSVDQVIDEIGCRKPADPKEMADGQLQFDVRTDLCGQRNACGVKLYASVHRDELEKIRDHLMGLPAPDEETTARIKGLRELYRNPRDNFNRGECWRSGDALITNECPARTPVLTKNKKHIEPICDVLAKAGIYYT